MESLILRRNYPMPVTFADLRRAASDWWFPWPTKRANERARWTAALKQATGATDDVYAVRDGREVHVARVARDEVFMGSCLADRIGDLLIVADEAGYWERPHEVRIDLQERIPTKRAIGKVVQRSLIEAEVRRGH